jgi:hypothetical protein
MNEDVGMGLRKPGGVVETHIAMKHEPHESRREKKVGYNEED